MSTTTATTTTNVPTLSVELQELQRQRAIIIKSRNMQANRLQAVIAGTLGYAANLAEKDRRKKFEEASAVIKGVMAGAATHKLERIIKTTMQGIVAFNDHKDFIEKRMLAVVKQLPVATWVGQPEQRGFGLLFLAIVIGETGDLSNYANPAKVWKRLGCAPWSFDGKTLMPATWRGGKEGKLPASEWEAAGYSPRRRSIAYLIGEGIVKQNSVKVEQAGGGDHGVDTDEGNATPGPYRRRYDDAKRLIKESHPDYTDLRCHRHGMLLATKMLLKNLWIVWRGADASLPLAPTYELPPRPSPPPSPKPVAAKRATGRRKAG